MLPSPNVIHRRLTAVLALLAGCEIGEGKADLPAATDDTPDSDVAEHTDPQLESDLADETDEADETDHAGETDEPDEPADTDHIDDTDEADETDEPADTDGPPDTDLTALEDTAAPVRPIPGIELLADCVLPTDWEPGDDDTGVPRLIRLVDCFPVPAHVDCPAPDAPPPWRAGRVGRFCITEETVCITSFEGRFDDVRDTAGWDTAEVSLTLTHDRCCYEYVGVVANYDCGRPWRCGGVQRVAQASTPADPAAARWLSDALAEHASIAAFARLTLDLLAHGAPAHLIAATQRAMADEIEHARAAFAIASRLAGQPLQPGRLPVSNDPVPDLIGLAVQTALDGGVNEAIAAGIAAARLRGARDPEVRRALERVVADECRHAVLAWEIVAWAIERGGDAVRTAVEAAIAAVAVPRLPEEAYVPALGLPGGRALRRACRRVLGGLGVG
jgi:hypothetical protein